MPRTVLVVDDIIGNREILKKILGKEYSVLEAGDGREAMAVMRQSHGQISVVLLDISMPHMDGYQVLDQMQSNAALSQLPVIVTTGKTEEEAEVKALTLGANDYITKPYNPTIIRQRIRNTIKLRETAATVNALQKDRLTGLRNREAFFEQAEKMIRTQEPGYFVMSCFNIDSFKVINDQYGTEKGDGVLKHVANTVSRCILSFGGLCCRIMADKFAMLYPRVYMDAKELGKAHWEATRPEGLGREISIRIGRYIVEDLSLPASAMYDRAALAEESIKGKYGVYIAQYDNSMRDHLLHEQRIVMEMGEALKTGQFETWFQPQYNHATGALIGAEALVRWRHPKDGLLVAPGDFIPVFERNGFIYEMDKYVWEQVCLLLRKWMDAGLSPLPVSVNISRHDLFHEDFYRVLTGLVKKYEIPIHLLCLEVTESAFAESSAQIVAVVKQLLRLGFTIEIDDFGSGYSSLNTLKDVPANILKLDMRFLESSADPLRGANILESIVRMAKLLGMSVIAEGVETKEQADYLQSIDCNYVQGYLYARPMPAAEYEALARKAFSPTK